MNRARAELELDAAIGNYHRAAERIRRPDDATQADWDAYAEARWHLMIANDRLRTQAQSFFVSILRGDER